eukprot:2384698-Pyramimonas_sp.AAC.1
MGEMLGSVCRDVSRRPVEPLLLSVDPPTAACSLPDAPNCDPSSSPPISHGSPNSIRVIPLSLRSPRVGPAAEVISGQTRRSQSACGAPAAVTSELG